LKHRVGFLGHFKNRAWHVTTGFSVWTWSSCLGPASPLVHACTHVHCHTGSASPLPRSRTRPRTQLTSALTRTPRSAGRWGPVSLAALPPPPSCPPGYSTTNVASTWPLYHHRRVCLTALPCSNLELSSRRVVKTVSACVDSKAPTPELLAFVPLHHQLRLHLPITRRTLAKLLSPSRRP